MELGYSSSSPVCLYYPCNGLCITCSPFGCLQCKPLVVLESSGTCVCGPPYNKYLDSNNDCQSKMNFSIVVNSVYSMSN